MIIIEPFGGLGNRMRVIASAMALSARTNQGIKLVWIPDSALNAAFLDLFEPIENIEVVNEIGKYKYVKASNQNNIKERLLAFCQNKLIGVDYCIKEPDFPKYVWNKKIHLLDIVRKKRNTYFHTCEELNFENNFEQFTKFIPVKPLQRRIDRVTALFDKHTIGVHIRKSDNKISTENSPTSLFLEKMEREIINDLRVSFFIATDDNETETELRSHFKNRIITRERELDRNTPAGIMDAVVDMYALSMTSRIYGSYWSSFSDIAARIGRVNLSILKKK